MATMWVDDVTHLLPFVLIVGEGKVVHWEGNGGKGSWLVSVNIWVVVCYLGLNERACVLLQSKQLLFGCLKRNWQNNIGCLEEGDGEP